MEPHPDDVRPDRGFFYSINMAIRRRVPRRRRLSPRSVRPHLARRRRERAELEAVGRAARGRLRARCRRLAPNSRGADDGGLPEPAVAESGCCRRLHPSSPVRLSPTRARGAARPDAAPLDYAFLLAVVSSRRRDLVSMRRRIAAFTALGELAFYGRLLVRRDLWPLVTRQRWLDPGEG